MVTWNSHDAFILSFVKFYSVKDSKNTLTSGGCAMPTYRRYR